MTASYFEGLARTYDRYRPGIPEAVCGVLSDLLCEENFKPSRLLDIGTGTGQVIFSCGHRFEQVVGIEMDAGMVSVAREKLARDPDLAGKTSFRVATAEEYLSAASADVDVVTICRAFHWLNQSHVLHLLDRIVSSNGYVVVCGDGSLWNASEPWARMVKETIQEFLGKGRRVRRSSDKRFEALQVPYLDIMRQSPFSQASRRDIRGSRVWTSEQVLGYLFSSTFAAPDLFGDRLAEFEASISKRLAEFGPEPLVEAYEFTMIIGQRPQSRS